MSNTTIQIKRSQTTAQPGSLKEGELAYSGNGSSNSLFIGLPDGSNTVTRIAGGKYGFLHNANTGNSTVAVIQGGKLTANAVLISDANSSIDEVRTAKLIINTSGNTANEITSISLFANTTQLGSSLSGSNTELVTAEAIKTYVDARTSSVGGTLANQQVAFSNGTVFQGSAGFTFDSSSNTLSVSNTISVSNAIVLGANVTLDFESLAIGATTINSSWADISYVNAPSVNSNYISAAAEVSVGSNVVLSTSTITVGNSTVNSVISATGIDIDGTLTVANAVTFSNGLSMSNTVISNVADPVNANDAANKKYVDAVAEGLHVHASVVAATPNTLAVISGGSVTYNNGTDGVGATLTLSTPITAIDNVSLTASNRVLVKNEANLAHNGIYVYSNSTVLTRATDFDTGVEIAGGDFIFVTGGDLYDSVGFVQKDEVITVGTDPIEWVQFSGAGSYLAGDFLYLDGNEFNVNATSNNTASVVVARDASGNFSANTITADLIGTANNATNLGGEAASYYTNATNISTGTLDTARLPATANISTAINVGANVNLTTSSITVGNSSVNTVITSTSIDTDGTLTVTNTANVGNTTITGFANVSSTMDVGGALTVTNTASLGNTTINGFANVTSTLAAGNTTITGFANISSTLAAGNTTITGFVDVTGSASLGTNNIFVNTTAVYVNTVINVANDIIPTTNNAVDLGSSALRFKDIYLSGNTIQLGNTTLSDDNGTLVVNNVSVTTDLQVDGNVVLGNNTSDIISIIGSVNTSIISSANLTYSLGNTTNRFAEVYAGNVVATNASFGDVSVSGNLTVTGTVTTIDTVNLVVEDSLIKLARNNEADVIDIGFYGKYANTPNRWTGLFRDASDSGTWKLFSTQAQPSDTGVDTANNTFAISTLEAYIKSGALSTNNTALSITANSSVSVSVTANTIAANVVTVTGATNNAIFFANSSGSLVELTLGVEGKVLQSNGTAVVYADLDGGTF